MSNKPTTKSYCVKRLRDNGYGIDRDDTIDYTPEDQRKWSIIMDNGGMSIFLTCYKDNTFHVYDGGRYTNTNMRLNTDSVEVLVQYLNERGLIHKHPRYGSQN
jgi:hypothetical protein